jgi:hypothetical protein
VVTGESYIKSGEGECKIANRVRVNQRAYWYYSKLYSDGEKVPFVPAGEVRAVDDYPSSHHHFLLSPSCWYAQETE